MKKYTALLFILLLSIGCSSHKANKQVKKDAAEVAPAMNPARQYSRAIAMINFNPDLSDEQKNKLVKLINDYSKNSYENKQKQSQFRVVLLDEMLQNDKDSYLKISAAKKKLTELDKENATQVETFVEDFKSIVGKSAKNNQPEILEVIMVQ